MAYTTINWDETTPINPDNLNKMDEQINDVTNGTDPVQLAEELTSGLSNVQWAMGDYSGSDEEKTITVGFDPTIVLVIEGKGETGRLANDFDKGVGLISSSHNVTRNTGDPILRMVSNGFRVGYYQDGTSDDSFNQSGKKYRWVAIKIDN